MRMLRCALALAVLTAGACANNDRSGADATVIPVSMVDNRFEPATFTVRKDRPVIFRFRNDGTVRHEAVIGDDQVQQDHAGAMDRMSDAGMGDMHHGAGEGAVVVDPGKSADLTMTFPRSGEVVIGCHQPGHYEAGMKATVTVVA
jgi:uncharacterized cupredoxin-like copper-binding protein